MLESTKNKSECPLKRGYFEELLDAHLRELRVRWHRLRRALLALLLPRAGFGQLRALAAAQVLRAEALRGARDLAQGSFEASGPGPPRSAPLQEVRTIRNTSNATSNALKSVHSPRG